MTTKQLGEHLQRHWETIRAKLLAGTYVPSPVERVEIPKPDGGKRMLGIPTVVDRWIQQMLLQVLQPIFDPAVQRAQLRVSTGAERTRGGEGGARTSPSGQRLGSGHGHHQVL